MKKLISALLFALYLSVTLTMAPQSASASWTSIIRSGGKIVDTASDVGRWARGPFRKTINWGRDIGKFIKEPLRKYDNDLVNVGKTIKNFGRGLYDDALDCGRYIGSKTGKLCSGTA